MQRDNDTAMMATNRSQAFQNEAPSVWIHGGKDFVIATITLGPATSMVAFKKDFEAQIFRRSSHEEDVIVPAIAEPLLVWIISGEAQA